jgi:alpha-methylacyl-CoA racemase
VPGALDGVRVLDLTRYGPGPFCAMLLGDLGAEVITVDEAHPGDPRRSRAMLGPGSVLGQRSGYMRRNARRIALNLKHAGGLAVARRILAGADVMLESFRPGVAARLGLDPEALIRDHPRLVVCSISGFGQDGPYRDRPGHDLNYLALGGFLDGNRGGGEAPVAPSTVLADLAAGGMQAAVGILAALLARERTGRGQLVDVSLQEGVVALVSPLVAWVAGDRLRDWTLLRGEAPWYQVYETSDGRHLAVAAVEPWFYATVCDALGHPEWVELQFDVSTWPAVREAMASIVRSQPLAVWQERLERLDSCVTAIPTIGEVLEDEQLKARGTFVEVEAGAGRQEVQVRPLPRLSETPASIRRGAVAYGHDTEDILAELGYAESERDSLRGAGAVGEALAGAR